MESEYMVLAPIMLQIVGLFLAVLIDPYIKKRDRRIMLAITCLVFSLVVQNYADYLSDQMGMDGNGPASYNSLRLGLFGTSGHPAAVYPPFEQEKEGYSSLWSGRCQYGDIFLCVFLADLLLDRRRPFSTRAFRIYLSCHQSYHAGLFLLSHHLRDTTCPEKGKHFSFAECGSDICRNRDRLFPCPSAKHYLSDYHHRQRKSFLLYLASSAICP